MVIRRSTLAREAVDGSGGGPGWPSRAGPAGVVMLRAEQLAYIGEIARELEAMAEQAGCATLAELLGLARREAAVQRQA